MTQRQKEIGSQFVIAVVCLALSMIFGCQTTIPETRVKMPASETPQDEALSKSVRERLLSLKTADLNSIKVISSRGTVYLTGTVESLDARQQAIRIAWTVPGVQSVINALEVRK